MMRGANPAHIQGRFLNFLSKKSKASSSAEQPSEVSGGERKKTYPKQENGILRMGSKSKLAMGAKESAKPESSNTRRVTINPEPELLEIQSTGQIRTKSMPVDKASATVALDRASLEAPPKPAELELPAWDSTSPGASRGSASLWDNVPIPGTPSSDGSPTYRPGRFGTWYQGPTLPLPPHSLRAGWDDSPAGSPPISPSDHSDNAHMFDTPTSPLSPAHKPGRYPGWNSPPASPTATPHAEAQPTLTRTESEAGAIPGRLVPESENAAGQTTSASPAAEEKASEISGKALGIIGVTAAVGLVTAGVVTAIASSGNANEGEGA